MVTAIIMAGGKGTRMGIEGEKPLLLIREKPMVQYVYEAVQASREVNQLIVAPQQIHTPNHRVC